MVDGQPEHVGERFPPQPGGLWGRMLRWWRGMGQLAVGWTLIAVGIILLVLPGPGLLVIFLGLSLLARHQHWAKRILERLRGLSHRKRRRG